MADELDELYEVKLEEFTALRAKLAAAAKQRGDADTAKQISAARKPTAAAWVVNRLALRDQDIRKRLAGLGERNRVLQHLQRVTEHVGMVEAVLLDAAQRLQLGQRRGAGA